MTAKQLILYVNHYRYLIPLTKSRYTISNQKQADFIIHCPDFPEFVVEKPADFWQVTVNNDTVKRLAVGEQTVFRVNDDRLCTLFLVDTVSGVLYDFFDNTELYAGNEDSCDVCLPSTCRFFLKKRLKDWHVFILAGELYHNNCLVQDHVLLQPGDQLAVADHVLIIYPEELHIYSRTAKMNKLQRINQSRYTFPDEYPDYHRSPRIIYRLSEKKVVVNAPAKEPSQPAQELLRTVLPSAVMIIMSVVMAFFSPRGIFMLAMVGSTSVSIIFSIISFIKSKKKYALEKQEWAEDYHNYLIQQSNDVYRLVKTQRDGLFYHYPAITELTAMASVLHARIYEKNREQFDFLFYRVGLGTIKNPASVTFSKSDSINLKDDLERTGYLLVQNNTVLTNVPITANLINGPVGYVGPRKLVIEQLHLLIQQLAFFQSYHDLQFVVLFPENERTQWQWLRWLPHASLQDINVRGFVYNQRSRDQVLNSLNQILKNRKNVLNEAGNLKDGILFTPHYVVMVTDQSLIIDHVIMEFFTEDPTVLGCSVIFVQDVMSSLSENVVTVIDIRDRNTGMLLIENGQLKETVFHLDHFPSDFDMEAMPRQLAALNHMQTLKSTIPDTVSFLEMYAVNCFEDFNIRRRWQKNSPHKSLAVPLGVRGHGDLVYLNLHEKAHGPHGLIAGTTGSGKSEVIQSYILSLAVNFHPHDVAFLLIDYKGGGMANLFKELPHLLGAITNLDKAQSMRALVSINAELKRRQHLFSKNDVNHINQYQKLYKEGEVSEPMPHLFLISDEFAELKSDQPEFMDELVSTARIGRSLGIHLILATQKPSGVVNDQIWSNSRFKLALKVADKADSIEIIKTPDAAEITQAGRAYLQVGNNEIYELFQSAWSGADYEPGREEQNKADFTIYRINELGQYDILNEDLSGLKDKQSVHKVPSQLEVIVKGIKQIAAEDGVLPLARPWLPPLATRIYLSDLHPVVFKDAWQTDKQPLRPIVGVVDRPSRQSQETVMLDLTKDGHLALFASPAYGKSSFMQTVLMDVARVHRPDQLHLYLLDFGTNGLLPLKKLPHAADLMGVDDEEKISKFSRRIHQEIKRRKQLLSEYAVASLRMYEKASGHIEPAIIICLDNFEGIKNTAFEEELEKLIVVVSREGASVGIHLLLTAGRSGSLRLTILGNIKIQIPLKLNDDMDVRHIVGRTQLTIDDVPGRGLLKLEEPELFQAALPAYGSDMLAIIHAIQKEAAEMGSYWHGPLPEPIPMMPDVIDFEQLKQHKQVVHAIQNGLLPIGLDYENVEPVILDFQAEKHLLIVSNKEEQLTYLTTKVFEAAVASNAHYKLVIVDPDGKFSACQNKADMYASETEELRSLESVILQEIHDRESTSQQTDQWLIIIGNLMQFINLTKMSDSSFVSLYEKSSKVGIHLVLSTMYNLIGTSFEPIAKFLRTHSSCALLGMRLMDQQIFDKVYQSKEQHLSKEEAYLYQNYHFTKLKT